MTSLLESSGGQPQKQPKYVPIFIDKAFTGLYTQRAILHDPSDYFTGRYGGRPDALLTGRNVELTNRLTLQRRPGMSTFGANYPTAPLRAYSFQLANGTIQLIVDTGSTGAMAITSCANASAGTTVYTGTFPGGAANGLANLWIQVTGFVTNLQNNGTFNCTASSATTITLSNATGIAETIAASAVSTGAVYLDNQNGSKTQLFAKLPGAGQSYFVAVAGVLYVGDGVATHKYTPLNTNGKIWNWGIVAPTSQPVINIQATGAAASAWQATTVFSTMGLTKDTNGTPQIWQVIGVNADGTNTTTPQFGTTGGGEPIWPTTEGNTVVDGGVTWTNAGALSDWTANAFYTDLGFFGSGGGPNLSRPGAIALAGTKTIYGNYKNSGALGQVGSAANEPHFSGAYPGPSGGYFDFNTHWFAIGSYSTPASMKAMRWKPSHAYTGWQAGGSTNTINGTASNIVLTGNLPAATGTTVYLFVPTTGGTSSSGYQPFPPNAGIGFTQGDAQISWLCLGQAAWQANHAYSPWTAPGQTFGVIHDGANFQVCTKTTGSGLSAGAPPTWNTGYGSTTIDGGVTWTCVGPTVNWSAIQTWNLPLAGFQPPGPSQAYGGSTVDASNAFVQAVISSGTSGGSAPSWPTITSAPPTVTDGSITWQAIAPITTRSTTWSFGLAYAYSYKARPIDDFYSPAPLGGGAVPPGGTALAAPFGSMTNAISSASPVFQITGANAGAVNKISGEYSPDPQVDTIVIYRSADTASGSANMFELTEIPNIPSQAGISQWQFNDYLPSVASGLYPGLNILLPAPIDNVNDPPPTAYLPQTYNYTRIWGSNGQSVPFSGGPDTNVGNPNEAFKASDELPFLAPVIRLVKTSQGIVTFLTNSIEMIGGGPATATFFSVPMAPGIGLLSYNACDVFAGEIYFFANDNSFRVITPSLNLSTFGFPLGDQFANQPTPGTSSDTTWDPAKVYVAVHQNGVDNCIFVADGSTGWYRLNPHQVPGAAQGPEPIWSPYATITGGCKMVESVETAPGIKKLISGGTAPGSSLLARNLTSFTDAGTPYDAYFVMGSIMFAHPGQLALIKFLEMDFSGVSYQPTISFLLNEVSGTFTQFVNGVNNTPQFDPPSIYGDTIVPGSYSPNRYYFSATGSLARCRHMQIKVDFGTTSNGDELYNMTIFGRLMTET